MRQTLIVRSLERTLKDKIANLIGFFECSTVTARMSTAGLVSVRIVYVALIMLTSPFGWIAGQLSAIVPCRLH